MFTMFAAVTLCTSKIMKESFLRKEKYEIVLNFAFKLSLSLEIPLQSLSLRTRKSDFSRKGLALRG